MDTSLTLKLQKRLTELEQEKQSLRNELENKEDQFQRARARVPEPFCALRNIVPSKCIIRTLIKHLLTSLI